MVRNLTQAEVAALSGRGKHRVSPNLYLQISKWDTRAWVFWYMVQGRAREMGLGSYPKIKLAAARELVEEFSAQLQRGIDPLETRAARKIEQRLVAAKSKTFGYCTEQYIEAHRASWKNAKHAAQWKSTLSTYAYPVLEKLPVAEVDTTLLIQVLEPIWSTTTETASRLRGRIEAVLDWATVRGFRSGDNPARWKGHLSKILPSAAAIQKKKHHPALPFEQLPEFLTDLRQREGISARALEFVVLTVARTGDLIGNDRDDKPPMKFSHVDFAARSWAVPSTKTETEHRVPLSDTALSLLKELKAAARADVVFGDADGPLSNMAMSKVIQRMNADREKRGLSRFVDPKQGDRDITVHGMRSTFRDWAAERTAHTNIVVEMALAHVIESKVEAAYRRGDLFDKRRKLMDHWAKFCAPVGDNVVRLSRKAKV